MGLAASQAKLLSITARIHDIEYEAQDIMNKKVVLATQKDDAYRDYINALDTQKLQISFSSGGKSGFIDATFTNLTAYDKNRDTNYALTDAYTGMMIVSDDIYQAYQDYQGLDKYAFALAMMGIQHDPSIDFLELVGVDDERDRNPDEGNAYSGTFVDKTTGENIGYMLMTRSEGEVYKSHEGSLKGNLSQLMTAFTSALETGDKKEIQSAIDAFRKELYKQYSDEIYSKMTENAGNISLDEFDKDKFDYYVRLFEGIESKGGCISINDVSNGDTGNEWLTNAVQSGIVMLNEYQNNQWKEVSIATSLNAQTTKDDLKIKKAELKYEETLSNIKDKDSQYDRDLTNLETERTALNTEMDSIKKVKDENIERTFGIFS